MTSSQSLRPRHTTGTDLDDRLNELVLSNPKADAAIVREGLRLVQELRSAGVKDQGYDLASPYGASVHSADEGVWHGTPPEPSKGQDS